MIERADRAPRVLGLHFAIAGAAHSDDGDAASGGDGAVCVAGCSFDEWRCEEPHAFKGAQPERGSIYARARERGRNHAVIQLAFLAVFLE